MPKRIRTGTCAKHNILERMNTMQQPHYKSNYELKLIARSQTGQHLGILLGTVVLKFIITSLIANVISSMIPAGTITGYVINYILLFAVEVAASILSVGASLIFLKTACGMKSSLEDLFFGLHNNTVKILKVGTVIVLIESICAIPLDIASLQYTDIVDAIPFFSENNVNSFSPFISGSLNNNDEFIKVYGEFAEAYSILYSATMKLCLIMLVCFTISLILTLPFFPAFYMILDFPDWNVSTILKRSFEVMSGNKLRLFLLYLSFIPSVLLSALACGIPLLWVIPYMNMTTTNFYLDLMSVRNKSIVSVS